MKTKILPEEVGSLREALAEVSTRMQMSPTKEVAMSPANVMGVEAGLSPANAGAEAVLAALQDLGEALSTTPTLHHKMPQPSAVLKTRTKDLGLHPVQLKRSLGQAS